MRNNSSSRKHCQPTWLQNTRLKRAHLANNFSYTISRVQSIATSCHSVLWRAYMWAMLWDCMIYGFSFHANGPAFVCMECSKQSFVLLFLFHFFFSLFHYKYAWVKLKITCHNQSMMKNIRVDIFKDNCKYFNLWE